MAGSNTEKPASIAEKKKNVVLKEKKQKIETPVEKVKEEKKNDDKAEPKKEVKVQPKVKKDTAIVNGRALHISEITAAFICRFIRNKKLDVAIKDLEDVIKMKKAVPMGTEVPHRKGKIGAGRYPKKAAGEILILVKSLKANANQNDMEEPVIKIASANKAQRPFGQRGRTRRKRAHVTLVAAEYKSMKKENKK